MTGAASRTGPNGIGAPAKSPRDLATLPKAHLHLHFTGSMRLATLQELASQRGIRIARGLSDPSALSLSPDERGWFRFQRLYDSARHAVASEAAMRRVVREAAEDDAAEGSGRLELQIDPTSYGPHVGGITPALEIVMDEARAASAGTGVEISLVVAASRLRHPLEARTLARLAARHAGDGPGEVVGFGLSNDERRGATEEFAPAFAIARAADLASVPHGGELLGANHVRQLVRALRPDRLGHGVRAIEQPALMRELADRGIALELCPLSNVALGVYSDAAAIPIRAILATGAQVTLSADDPLIFGSRLVDQYRMLREVHGFADQELAALAETSVLASRATESTKRRLADGIRRWLSNP
ncbi:MAG: adenosine deaminase [Bifidobacteriaceae bacterium]|jgi:adenosine deaminase|nr:adenosine deaminase [Bifidobacteriaceae bacterium]